MIVGCYSTDAYCDGNDRDKYGDVDYMRHMFPEQYGPVSDGGRHQVHCASETGQTKTETYKKLRARGWRINAIHNRAFCPGCVELGRDKV